MKICKMNNAKTMEGFRQERCWNPILIDFDDTPLNEDRITSKQCRRTSVTR